jgi:hypothetical protein
MIVRDVHSQCLYPGGQNANLLTAQQAAEVKTASLQRTQKAVKTAAFDL